MRRSAKSRACGMFRPPFIAPSRGHRTVNSRMRNQRGVALISILLIVALVTALMYHLMTRQAFVVAQTRQIIRADQSLAYALGAEAYARQILYRRLESARRARARYADASRGPCRRRRSISKPERSNCPSRTSTGDSISTRWPVRHIEESGAVQDAAGAHWGSIRWLQMRGATGSTRTREAAGFGAEDGAYLVATPPYRTANQPAASTSEIALLGLLDAGSTRTIAAVRHSVADDRHSRST